MTAPSQTYLSLPNNALHQTRTQISTPVHFTQDSSQTLSRMMSAWQVNYLSKTFKTIVIVFQLSMEFIHLSDLKSKSVSGIMVSFHILYLL